MLKAAQRENFLLIIYCFITMAAAFSGEQRCERNGNRAPEIFLLAATAPSPSTRHPIVEHWIIRPFGQWTIGSKYQSPIRPFHHSIIASVDHSTNRPFDRSSHQSINRSSTRHPVVEHWIIRSIDHSIKRPFHHSITPSFHHSIIPSILPSIYQPMDGLGTPHFFLANRPAPRIISMGFIVNF